MEATGYVSLRHFFFLFYNFLKPEFNFAEFDVGAIF